MPTFYSPLPTLSIPFVPSANFSLTDIVLRGILYNERQVILMTQGERVKAIRSTLKLTLEKFGEKLGVGKTAISKIEKGERSLTVQMMKAICNEYRVNYEYLESGVGEEQYDLDDFDRIMLQEYLKMDEASRNVLKTYIRKICGQISEVDDTQSKIDAEVESYRQELELEARQADESSASDTPAENMA